MEIVSLELCKEIHKVSGWEDVDAMWCKYSLNQDPQVLAVSYKHKDELMLLSGTREYTFPAYSVGYLLRKLPKHFDGYFFDMSVTTNDNWVCEYFTNDYTPDRPISIHVSEAKEPENALAKIVIKLFKQGILK